MKKISLSTSYGPKKQPKSISDIARKQRERKQRKTAKQAKLKSTLSPPDEPLEDACVVLDTIGRCTTKKEVDRVRRKDRRSWAGKVNRSFKRRLVSRDIRRILEAVSDGANVTSTAIMASSSVQDQAYNTMVRELTAYFAAKPDHEICFVTTLSGSDATSYHKPIVPLFDFKQRVTSTLRAISPDFIGVLELAMFKSHTHPDGGQLIQGHGHFFCIGKGVTAKARAVAKKHAGRYTPNVTGAKAIVVRTMSNDPENLARMCAYLLKPPHRCKSWNPPKEDRAGTMHQGETGDRYLRYLRMAQIRSMMTIEDITVGGGEGQRIRSVINKLVRAQCEAAVPQHNRPLHPDAIASFWVEVTKELGKNEWHLPVIRTRK